MNHFINPVVFSAGIATGLYGLYQSGIISTTLHSIISQAVEEFSTSAQEEVPKITTAVFKGFEREFNDTFTPKNTEDMANRIQEVSSTMSNAVLDGMASAISPERIQRTLNNTFTPEATQALASKLKEVSNKLTTAITDGMSSAIAKSLMKNLVPATLIYGGVIVALPLSLNYLHARLKHNIGKPKLADQARHYSWLSIINPFSSVYSKEKAPQPILEAQTASRIKEITTAIKNIKNNNGYFQNLLLWGPGGNGKKMIAQRIAMESDLNYDFILGNQFAEFISRGEHISELKKLFAKAESSSRPTIIFIDKCETLCKGDSHLNREHMEIFNTFLNKIGTPSKKIMLIMSTNHSPQDLDPDILNCMDHKIQIGKPGWEQRAQMIQMYAKEFFGSNQTEMDTFFNDHEAKQLAAKTNGFTGLAIFKLLNRITTTKTASQDNKLTHQMIIKTVEDFKAQEKDLEML